MSEPEKCDGNEQAEHQAHDREEEAMHRRHAHEEETLHREHVEEEEELHKEHEREEHEHQKLVTITVDDKPVEIKSGSETVPVIKSLGGVAQGFVLVEVVGGRDVPLADDGRIDIKGGEVFESHAPDGGSS